MYELLQALALPAVVLESDGRVSCANDALLELLGRSRAEVEGAWWFDLAIAPERRAALQQVFRELLEGSRDGCSYENPIVCGTGESKLVEWKNAVVRDPQTQRLQVVSIGRDVTLERHAQSQMAMVDASIDSAVSGIAFADLNGQITRVNRAFLDAWGLRTEAEAVGRAATDFWVSPERAQATLAALLSDGKVDGELVAKTAHGPRMMRLRASVVRGLDGEPAAIMGTFNDVSDLRQAEARLLEAQRIAHVGDWAWRQLDGSLWWSDEVYRIFGEDRERFTPSFEKFVEHVLEEDMPAVSAAIEKALQSGAPYTVDHRIRRPNGEIRWVQENGEILRGADGEHLGLVGTVQDVTTRREAEEALRKTTDLLRAVVASSPVVVFAIDRDARLTLMEGRPLARAGLEPHRTVGRPVKEVFEDGPELADAARRAIEGETVRVAGRLGPLEIEATYGPQMDARGDIVGAVGVAFDVTERRRLEEQLAQSQKIEAVGMLAGGVAHDFNNLLAVILSAGHLIQAADQLRGEAADDLRQILDAAGRAAVLTQQLLALGRRQVIEPVLLDVNEELRSLKQMLRRLIGADVVVRMRCEEDLPAVLADRSQLEQVLMNLIVNARDAMPTGGTLTLSTSRRVLAGRHHSLPEGEYVSVEVGDNGVGMEASVQEKIFQPFFTTKEAGRGTGLGLATCYGIVRQSGGVIEVESVVGQGTRITVLLPAVARPAEEGVPRMDAGPSLAGLRVLLVEDDPQLRLVTTRCLEQAGWSVRAASDGIEALELLREMADRFDVVLTDVVLPGLSGADFARRARSELRVELPFIFLSGYTDDTALRYGVETQGVPFVRKPFTPAELVSKVSQVVARAKHD